jgi:sialate O-acetylesterase
MFSTALIVALLGRATDFGPYDAPLEAEAAPTKSFLSSTLGSHMVLQAATHGPNLSGASPKQAVVWGFVAAGTVVTTIMDGAHKMTTAADASGTWKQTLPATAASMTPHSFSFSATTIGGGVLTARIDDVLFGDVYLCGGQSNMQFAMPAITNASEEAARAEHYPSIRLFTVGQKTASKVPLDDLQSVAQPWSVANSTSVAGGGGFGHFSAVCWIFGREVFDALGGTIPIGLISSNWGGTPVESWTTPAALQACNVSTVDSTLYNAMIQPYTIGPMGLTGFTWYQGEANVDERGGDEGATRYACTFPAMISQWRSAFAQPEAYFGFIQLSTWCGDGERIAEMRTRGQMAALALPKVGYATNADHGAGCNIHPPPKQFCARRLAASAMAIAYGRTVAWRSPSFSSQRASVAVAASANLVTNAAASLPSVTVNLRDVSIAGVRDDQYPYNYLGGTFNCTEAAGKCAWAELQLADGKWVNATLAVTSGGAALTLTAAAAPLAGAGAGPPVASRYGWGAVPMLSVYDKQTGLPLLPWSETVAAGLVEDVGEAA